MYVVNSNGGSLDFIINHALPVKTPLNQTFGTIPQLDILFPHS